MGCANTKAGVAASTSAHGAVDPEAAKNEVNPPTLVVGDAENTEVNGTANGNEEPGGVNEAQTTEDLNALAQSQPKEASAKPEENIEKAPIPEEPTEKEEKPSSVPEPEIISNEVIIEEAPVATSEDVPSVDDESPIKDDSCKDISDDIKLPKECDNPDSGYDTPAVPEAAEAS